MREIVLSLKATGLSRWVNGSVWVWPACETLHFIGLALLVGAAGALDLRLMGFMRRVPLCAMMELVPWAAAGFAINLGTGALFVVAAPDNYIDNPAFYFKILFIVIGGLNAASFQMLMGREIREISARAGEDTPLAAKVVGSLSLLTWFAVMCCGRLLPFVGKAF